MYKVHRYHDISAGHRVSGHESKCQHLHGHNYRIHFTCSAGEGAESLDKLGRVIDFGVVKEKLCMWVEEHWDHKFLHWVEDDLIYFLIECVAQADELIHRQFCRENDMFSESLVSLPFNPTAENMAQYLVEVIGPQQLEGTGVRLVSVMIEETAKCHATYEVHNA